MTDTKNDELVEAVLFIAGRFLKIQDLMKYTNINPLMIRESLKRLNEKYDKHSTLQVIEMENAYKMDVRAEVSYLINKIATGSTEFTKAEQETLAVIAYKQPITQATIVKIRGNKSYEHIKNLIQAGLIKAKKAGRTIELQTKESFYDYFKIQRKNEELENLENPQDEKTSVDETKEEIEEKTFDDNENKELLKEES